MGIEMIIGLGLLFWVTPIIIIVIGEIIEKWDNIHYIKDIFKNIYDSDEEAILIFFPVINIIPMLYYIPCEIIPFILKSIFNFIYKHISKLGIWEFYKTIFVYIGNIKIH